ncbi:hypothetical protein AURDEDRAFT_169183 [Auricularia subglabra TFB-10046 SS5]|nr:hypothetical protein AURDEDRAFT_169183 [Auricularia subglabra TFB-10046 SS5]
MGPRLELQGYQCDGELWTKCADEDVAACFLRDSWGAPGYRRLEESGMQGDVLQVVPPALSKRWSIGAATDGRLYMRKEIPLAWARITDAFAQRWSGVLLTGDPGSGTTFSLLYILLRCLADERLVMLTPPEGTTHLFTAQGVYTARAASLRNTDIPYKRMSGKEGRVWSLVDTDGVLSCAYDSLRSPGMVFAVYASPWSDERWVRKHNPARCIMDSWSLEELQRCIPLHGEHEQVSDAEVAAAMAQSGPTPRAVLEYLRDPVAYAEGRAAALADVRSPRELTRLIYGTGTTRPSSDADARQLFTVHRWVAPTQCGLDEHVSGIEVRSDVVLNALRHRFEDLGYQAALTLLGACSATPKKSRLAAWFYEVVACALLSDDAVLSPRELDDFYRIQRGLCAGHDTEVDVI